MMIRLVVVTILCLMGTIRGFRVARKLFSARNKVLSAVTLCSSRFSQFHFHLLIYIYFHLAICLHNARFAGCLDQ
jgi:hypothetical protein